MRDPGGLRFRRGLFYEIPLMPQDEQEFRPRGAVAFFATMLVFFAVVWLFFYALLIHRH